MGPRPCPAYNRLAEAGGNFLSHLEAAGTDARTNDNLDVARLTPVLGAEGTDSIRQHSVHCASPPGMHRSHGAGDRIRQQDGYAVGCANADEYTRTIRDNSIGFRAFPAPRPVRPDPASGMHLPQRGRSEPVHSECLGDRALLRPLEEIASRTGREAMDQPGVLAPPREAQDPALVDREHFALEPEQPGRIGLGHLVDFLLGKAGLPQLGKEDGEAIGVDGIH